MSDDRDRPDEPRDIKVECVEADLSGRTWIVEFPKCGLCADRDKLKAERDRYREALVDILEESEDAWVKKLAKKALEGN